MKLYDSLSPKLFLFLTISFFALSSYAQNNAYLGTTAPENFRESPNVKPDYVPLRGVSCDPVPGAIGDLDVPCGPDGPGNENDPNGGNNVIGCPLQVIPVNSILDGIGFTFVNTTNGFNSRDTDWYSIDLTGQDAVTVSITCTEFDGDLFLLTDPCGSPAIEVDPAFGTTTESINGSPPTVSDGSLAISGGSFGEFVIGDEDGMPFPNGTTAYVFFAPQTFTGSDCVTTMNEYTLAVSSVVTVVPTLGQWGLIIFGLLVLSLGLVKVWQAQRTPALAKA